MILTKNELQQQLTDLEDRLNRINLLNSIRYIKKNHCSATITYQVSDDIFNFVDSDYKHLYKTFKEIDQLYRGVVSIKSVLQEVSI